MKGEELVEWSLAQIAMVTGKKTVAKSWRFFD